MFVDLKIKQDIWNHKYVDFSSLLPRDERPKQTEKWVIQITNESIETKTSDDNLLTNFALWDRAFHIFLSIHTDNPLGSDPRLLRDLLCYRETILDINRRNGNFAKYDHLFRRYIQNSGSRSYNVRLSDLYEKCVHQSRVNQNLDTKRNQTSNIPFCRKFQNGGCSKPNCQYMHRCEKCRYRSHGSRYCRVQQTSNSRPGGENRNNSNKTPDSSRNGNLSNLFGGL